MHDAISWLLIIIALVEALVACSCPLPCLPDHFPAAPPCGCQTLISLTERAYGVCRLRRRQPPAHQLCLESLVQGLCELFDPKCSEKWLLRTSEASELLYHLIGNQSSIGGLASLRLPHAQARAYARSSRAGHGDDLSRHSGHVAPVISSLMTTTWGPIGIAGPLAPSILL